jgi:hypothetical protein
MKSHGRWFWVGLCLYGVSFCVIALGQTSASPGTQPLFGYYCAFFAFVYPWVEARDALLHNVPLAFSPVACVILLISGWINVMFLGTTFLALIALSPRAFVVGRILVFSMVPFSWVFAFYYLRAYPREGHFLWVFGMLLVLLSNGSRASATDSRG